MFRDHMVRVNRKFIGEPFPRLSQLSVLRRAIMLSVVWYSTLSAARRGTISVTYSQYQGIVGQNLREEGMPPVFWIH